MPVLAYLNLVVRRIWARRLMLLGSFLGATLVTALLVVLPLYEASVSAVDLLFTFRQAPDTAVNLSAVHSSNDYTPEQAVAARQAVEEAAEPLNTWYPTMDERTLSREFSFIPLQNPDWLALADAWRQAGGTASEEPAPYPSPPQEATQTRFITAPDIIERVEILEGEFPVGGEPGGMEDPILRIVIGEDLARFTGLGPGEQIVLRAFISQPPWFELVEVAGIGRPLDPDHNIWEATDPARLVMLAPSDFDAWMGTFESDPEADPWLREERGFHRVTTGQTFTLDLDREAVTLGTVESLTGRVHGFVAEVARTEGIRTVTQLPGLVQEFDVRSVALGAPILAMLALIVAGALYFLIYMAALALERDANDLALLRMRGASPWQTTGLHLLQSALIALAAIAVAPLVARFLVSFTGRIPPMSTLTGGEPVTVVQSRSIIPFVLAGGVLTFLSMGLAILPLARRSVLELRALSTRPVHKSVWQRYHLDLFLVVLAGVILFELRQEGLVDTDPSELGLDPFSIAAPALFLFAGALLLLRILPWVLRGIGWVMTRPRGMTAALPGWHLGRNPIPYGRLALLVWLTTGFGAFALTYAGTLERSYVDRAGFAVGSDARIVADDAAYLEVPEDAVATRVLRGTGAPRLAGRGSELLAVDPATFPDVVAWRSDFGAPEPDDVFGPEILGTGPDWGVALLPGASALTVDGVVVPPPWAQREQEGAAAPVRFMVRLVDEDGRFRVQAADVAFDDAAWREVTVDLSGAAALNGPFEDAETLVLQAAWVETDADEVTASLEAGRLLFQEITVVSDQGDDETTGAFIAELITQGGLVAEPVDAAHAATEFFAEVPEGEQQPGLDEIRQSPRYREGDATMWTFPTRTRADPVPHVAREPEPIPIVMDRAAASSSAMTVGSEGVFGVEGGQIPGTVAALVDLVPTTGDVRFDGVMVVPLDGLRQWLSGSPTWSLTGTIARTAEPQELWIRSGDPNRVVAALTARLPGEAEQVITAAGVSADFSSRPVQVGLVSILFLGTGAGVVLALAGVTAYVLVAVRRRYREMGVLRAIGFRRRGVAGTFALEQVIVLGVGAVVGVLAGLGLMRLMLPFLQLGEEGQNLLPPAVMVLPATRLVLYLMVVAGLLVASVLWSTRSVSARRLSAVLREVER